jgi:hypothetical protein
MRYVGQRGMNNEFFFSKLCVSRSKHMYFFTVICMFLKCVPSLTYNKESEKPVYDMNNH